MRNPLPWSAKSKEDAAEQLDSELESGKSLPKQKEDNQLEQPPRKPRQKVEKDVGSRWVAPILLLITILISLALKLFNQN